MYVHDVGHERIGHTVVVVSTIYHYHHIVHNIYNLYVYCGVSLHWEEG